MVDSAVNIIKQAYQFSSGQVNAALNNADETSFHKELTGIMSERASDGSLPADNADLSELTAPCGREITEASQDEAEEAAEAGDDIIFDLFDHFEACLECEDREHCKHYLGMTGASEEEIAKADIIVKSPYDKYKDTVHEQLSRSLRTSIIYNYNIICPEIEKKPKRDK